MSGVKSIESRAEKQFSLTTLLLEDPIYEQPD